jgi:hypothetical protein
LAISIITHTAMRDDAILVVKYCYLRYHHYPRYHRYLRYHDRYQIATIATHATRYLITALRLYEYIVSRARRYVSK